MDEPKERPVQFPIQVAPELEGGVYANFLSVWHSQHEFTLDFAALQHPQVPDDPETPVTVPGRVVARVRIPPTLVFDVLRALSDNLGKYEDSLGPIRRPEPPQEDEG